MTKKRKLVPAAFQGVLRAGEKPLRVATAEEGRRACGSSATRARRRPTASSRDSERTARSHRPRCLSRRPTRSASSGRAREPFAGASALSSFRRRYQPRGRGLTFLLSHVSNPTPEGLFPMYADAVAVAGLNAFESFGRRAVLLVLGRVAEDSSTYRPAVVRRYLDLLRVPLLSGRSRTSRRGAPPGARSRRSGHARACARLTPESARASIPREFFGSKAATSLRRLSLPAGRTELNWSTDQWGLAIWPGLALELHLPTFEFARRRSPMRVVQEGSALSVDAGASAGDVALLTNSIREERRRSVWIAAWRSASATARAPSAAASSSG